MTDPLLERLLDWYMGNNYPITSEILDIKSQINEKLEKAEKYDMAQKVGLNIIDGSRIEVIKQEQQIKQLKEELEIKNEMFSGSRKMPESTTNTEKSARVVTNELRNEIQSLKTQNEKYKQVIDEIKEYNVFLSDFRLLSILSEVEKE